MANRKKEKALVVLSGGADSTTCLYWAKQEFGEVHAVTFNYNQRHSREIEAACCIASMAGIADKHEVVSLGPILKGTSPLVDKSKDVGHYESVAKLPGGLEDTFVPGRNILFLTLAANRAYCLGAKHLVTGLCEEDYGGYPDCRAAFVDRMEAALNSGLYGNQYTLCIQTPLMYLTKKESVEMAANLPGCMDALAYSLTCYDGCYPPNPKNHASLLRAKGFAQADRSDPLILRAKDEGLLPPDYPNTGLVEGTKYDVVGFMRPDANGEKRWSPDGE